MVNAAVPHAPAAWVRPDVPPVRTTQRARAALHLTRLRRRGGELLALASLDEAGGFFGPSLVLHAFRLSASGRTWEPAGIVCRNAINNFPPERLPDGQWMMSRRPHNYRDVGVHFLIGGVDTIDQWASFPVLGSNTEAVRGRAATGGRYRTDAWRRSSATAGGAASCIARSPRTADAPGVCRSNQLPGCNIQIQWSAASRRSLRARLESQPEEARSAHTVDQR